MSDGRDLVDNLARLSLFADLSRPELEKLAHTVEEEVFAEGQRVLRTGLSGAGFFVILEGQAAIQVDGEERWTLGPGDFFGEASVLTGEPAQRGRRREEPPAVRGRLRPGPRAVPARAAATDASPPSGRGASTAHCARMALVDKTVSAR